MDKMIKLINSKTLRDYLKKTKYELSLIDKYLIIEYSTQVDVKTKSGMLKSILEADSIEGRLREHFKNLIKSYDFVDEINQNDFIYTLNFCTYPKEVIDTDNLIDKDYKQLIRYAKRQAKFWYNNKNVRYTISVLDRKDFKTRKAIIYLDSDFKIYDIYLTDSIATSLTNACTIPMIFEVGDVVRFYDENTEHEIVKIDGNDIYLDCDYFPYSQLNLELVKQKM